MHWSRPTPAGRRGVTLPAGTGEQRQVPPLPAQYLLLKLEVWTWHLALPPQHRQKGHRRSEDRGSNTDVCHQLAFLGFGLLTFHVSMTA